MAPAFLDKLLKRNQEAPEVLGIHVGRNTLTVARIAKRPGVTRLLQLFHADLPRDPGGWPVQLAGEVLKRARRTVNLRCDEAHVTLAGDLAPSQFFLMPSMGRDQLENALKLKLEEKWGKVAAGLCYEIQTVEKRGDRCRVFAASMLSELLRCVLGSLAEVNCHVDVMEVEPITAANLLAYCGLSRNAPIAVLSIAHNWSEIAIVRHKKVVLTRAIPKVEDEDAGIEADAGPRLGGEILPLGDDVPPLDPSYLGRVALEANKALDYFEIELLSPAVERLILTGRAARVDRLAPLIGDELQLACGPLDTEGKIEDETGDYDPPRHGLAVGAAIGEEAYSED
jgi:hypothetical protein